MFLGHLAASLAAARAYTRGRRVPRAFLALVATLSALYLVNLFGPPPPSTTAVAVSALALAPLLWWWGNRATTDAPPPLR